MKTLPDYIGWWYCPPPIYIEIRRDENSNLFGTIGGRATKLSDLYDGDGWRGPFNTREEAVADADALFGGKQEIGSLSLKLPPPHRSAELVIKPDITAYESALLMAWLMNAQVGISDGMLVPSEIARHFVFQDGDSEGGITSLNVPSHPKKGSYWDP